MVPVARQKKEACPVGCGYVELPGRVKQHVERKRDELHAEYRRANGIGAQVAEPAGTPTPEPASEPARESEPAATSAAEIVVDFGDAVPEVAPLVEKPVPEAAPAPAAEPPARELGQKPGRSPPVEPAGEEEALPLVGEEGQLAEAPAGAGAQHGAPSLGSAVRDVPHLRNLINRVALGATNTFVIKEELGDTPLSMQEIDALNLPETVAATLDYLERKYGWTIDLDHPLVWLSVAGGMWWGVVKKHRAPRDAQPPADEHDEPAEAPERAPAAPAETEEPTPFGAQLAAVLR